MPLYHCSPIWMEPGSVIRPGNFGRVLMHYGPQHNLWLREQFLEFMRKQEFPDKPSRLSSAFACKDLPAAEHFRQISWASALVYEVELTDPKAKSHVADFNCVQPIRGKIEDMHEVARHYWGASYWFTISDKPALKCAETLAECGMRIIAEVG